MNSYELTVIVRNKEVESLKEKVKSILQKHGVNITLEDHWGVRKLAYQIDGEKDGYYCFMNIESPADSIKKVISDFRLNSDVLRHLFVKLQKKVSA